MSNTLHPALRRLRTRVYHVRQHGAYRRLLTRCSRRDSSRAMFWHRRQLHYMRKYVLLDGSDDMVRVRYWFGSPWPFDLTPF